tara:strand:+ start:426 stop:581 length:156 start_codon:yes stop_codon:yes gene_type:complete
MQHSMLDEELYRSPISNELQEALFHQQQTTCSIIDSHRPYVKIALFLTSFA